MTERDEAIRYCLSLGLDPHAQVPGVIDGEAFTMARYQWYVGARAGQ